MDGEGYVLVSGNDLRECIRLRFDPTYLESSSCYLSIRNFLVHSFADFSGQMKELLNLEAFETHCMLLEHKK